MASCQEIDLILPSQEVLVFPGLVFIILTVVLGLLVAFLLAVPFIKELGKKKIQKSEKIIGGNNRMIVNDWDGVQEDGVYYVGGAARETTSTYRKMQKQRKRDDHEMAAVSYRNETDTTIDEEEREAGEEDDENNSFFVSYHGIVSILSRSGQSARAREKAMEDLSIEDIREAWTLQTETQKEKSNIFVSALGILLGKFAANERIGETYAKELVQRYQQKIEEQEETIIIELSQLEDDIRKTEKSNLEIEEELEMKRPEYSRRMASVVDSISLELREELLKNSGLNESEVDALYEKLFKYLTMTEKMIGEEVEEQSTILQDRLTKRQALAQQYADLSTRESKETQTQISEMRNILSSGVEDQKLTHMQMERIVKDYKDGQALANEHYRSELDRQSRDLMKKLKDHRDAAMAKLQDKQAKEREKFEDAARNAVNPSDVVLAHHDLRQQQRNESNEMIDELDYNEAEAMSVLRKRLAERKKEEAGELTVKIVETLTEETRMSEKEAEKIMKKHQANCTAYEEQLAKEKQEQSEMLQRKIQDRKEAWEKEKEREKVEQEQLAKQQEKTVTKVLDSQSGLEDEARKRIMLQHEQNSASLQNHLQLTRLRQQKLLEAKLSKNKARIDSLKEQQLKEAAAADDEDEAKTIKNQHDEELATEMSEYHKEHEKTVAVFRTKIALETSEMLKAQDEQMGSLLGRLQVGQARRRGIIEKQDKAIQELQEKLVDTVGDNNRVSEKKTERIIQRHLREVEEVEDKMRQAREHQARILQEKYETQKLMREKTILAQMEVTKPARSKTEISTTAMEVLNKIYEDSKQEQALKQIQQEMKSELMQQKQAMDRQLQEAMKNELEEREKDFLGDLAAVGELRKDELTDLVSAAIEDSGGDEHAQSIKKDIIKRYKSAKARSDAEGNSSGEQSPPTKRKGKKGKKKR
ncbi:uncharacterized protein [Apostichopus japonicus]|uniref:uncharacterized protein isoform X2 n=1 Tax=Stichopus japonicus TaxID=307972 RepID=UPI003AB71E11